MTFCRITKNLLILIEMTCLAAPVFAQESMGNSNTTQQQLQLLQQLQQRAPVPGSATNSAPVNNPPQNSNLPTPGSAAAPQPPLTANMQQSSPPPVAPGTGQDIIQANTQDINQSAFRGMGKQLLPLSPSQIHRLKQMYEETQYAAAAPANIPPRPTATSRYVSLAPGATPPVIRLASGFITSLVFLDSSGSPWPIDGYDLGNPSAYNVQWNRKDNTLMIQALTLYTYGNLAVRLRGAPAPVMLTLMPGQQAVDYRVDLRVQGLGPNANMPAAEGLPAQANSELLGVLDGIPPAGSKLLSLTGGEGQVWLKGDKMYVRTHLTVLSPGWLATMASADGTRAYEMTKSPLILASSNGKITQLKIEGF